MEMLTYSYMACELSPYSVSDILDKIRAVNLSVAVTQVSKEKSPTLPVAPSVLATQILYTIMLISLGRRKFIDLGQTLGKPWVIVVGNGCFDRIRYTRLVLF